MVYLAVIALLWAAVDSYLTVEKLQLLGAEAEDNPIARYVAKVSYGLAGVVLFIQSSLFVGVLGFLGYHDALAIYAGFKLAMATMHYRANLIFKLIQQEIEEKTNGSENSVE